MLTKELRELARAIETAKAEARKLAGEDKLDEAEAKVAEARDMQRKFNVMQEAEAEELEEREGAPADKPASPVSEERRAELFKRYMKFAATPDEVRELQSKYGVREATPTLSTGAAASGGILIPDNYMAEIVKSITVANSVRNLVRVTPVSLPTGTAPRRIAEAGKLSNLDEYGEVKQVAAPTYGAIKYALHKYGDYMPVSREMVEDPVFDIMAEVREWFADLARNTENYQVFYGAGDTANPKGIFAATAGYSSTTKATPTIADLRAFALKIGKGYWATSKWVMNTDAFLMLQDIKDGEGRSILQEDPKNDFEYRLLGRPVEIWDEIATAEGTNKTNILFGDFAKGYRMFVRAPFEMATSAEAGFLTDSTYVRGIERIDGQPWDTKAIRILKDVVIPA